MTLISRARRWIGSRRRQQILSFCDLSGIGLEIGGSFQPIAPKSEGYRVETLDHLDQEGLRRKYEGLPGIDIQRIEPVDFVWNGRTYAEIVGEHNRYSWIVASHVIEHVPDMIGFLKDCSSVLEEGGVLALAIPDQRFTMDRDRPTSGLAQALDAHLRRDDRPSVGALMEIHARAVSKWGRINWRPFHLGPTRRINEPSSYHAQFERLKRETGYVDEHVWCHTPESFRILHRELRAIGAVELDWIDGQTAWGLEFYVWLRKPVSSKEP
jgi:hypothetical protein